jgi:hypothetical protein
VAGTVATLAIAGGAAAVEYIIKRFIGKPYSKKNLDRLEALSPLYESNLGVKLPEYCELKDGKPVFCFAPDRRYDAYLNTLEENREGIQNYNKHSKIISKYISSYLAKRQKRLMDNGTKGDFLELFFNEWLIWSATKLPTLAYDDESIKIFNKRLAYIEAVREEPNFFPHPKISGEITKHDALDFIERELHKCIAKTKEEQERNTALTHFSNIRDKNSKIINECLNVIFYARNQSAHELPLVDEDYVAPRLDKTHSALVRDILPKILTTHSGEMLLATIILTRNHDINALQSSDKEIFDYYFNPDLTPKNLRWDLARCDLPPWIPKKLYNHQMRAIQDLCLGILKLNDVMRLIDDAYTLCTYKGSLWAYGDAKGKKSIEGLLHVYESVLSELAQNFSKFYTFNKVKQKIYNKDKENNYDADVDINLKNVKSSIKLIQKFKEESILESGKIRAQIESFPIDMEKKVNKKLKPFFQGVRNSLIKYTPKSSYIFSFAEDDTDSEIASEESSPNPGDVTNSKVLTETTTVLNFSFYNPEQTNHSKANDIIDKSITNLILSQPWEIGDNYDEWYKGFFIRNKSFFENFKSALPLELSKAFQESKVDLINEFSLKIQDIFDKFIVKINDEKPKWRFKYFFMPVTVGWPFNRKAAQFAQLLIQRLHGKKLEVTSFIAVKIEEIKVHTPTQSTNPKPTGGLEAIYQRSDLLINRVLHGTPADRETKHNSIPPLGDNEADVSTSHEISNLDNAEAVNCFEEWCHQFSNLIHDWATTGFTSVLNVFSNQPVANEVLTNFYNYRLSLGEQIDEFMEQCSDTKSQVELYSTALHQANRIDPASRNQLNLVLQLLVVLRSPPTSVEYANNLTEFKRISNDVFTHNGINSHLEDESKEEGTRESKEECILPRSNHAM